MADQARTQPIGNAYGFGMNPSQYFGGAFDAPGGPHPGNVGFGMYGLPDAFTNWAAPARYSFAPALAFAQGTEPIADYYRGELEKDYSGTLMNRAQNRIDTQVGEARRLSQQSLQRSGQGGGVATSPLAASMLQQEEMARGGALGMAAQQAVLQSQQMRSAAARGLQDVMAQRMQALLTPAQFQAAQTAQVPIGQAGPSLVGPALGAAGSFFNALA